MHIKLSNQHLRVFFYEMYMDNAEYQIGDLATLMRSQETTLQRYQIFRFE
jgi:hypothetical protein